MKNAIVLCSGGLDSVTTAYLIKKRLKFKKIILMFFDYEQRNKKSEEYFSRKCAERIGAEFRKIELSELAKLSTSMLNSDGKATKINDLKNTKIESEKWYVPCRNLIFLNYAAALTESIFVKTKSRCEIFVGFKNEGEESYPDTTKEFVDSLNKVFKISTDSKPVVKAPLIEMDKEDIVLLAQKLGVDFRETFSCYVSTTRKHCGECLACQLRKKGFYWANVEDGAEYVS